jgi:hypothetical protein
MKTVGPLYSGKLIVQWDEKGMETMKKLKDFAETMNPLFDLTNHSFTLEW